jgi:hypothetical protein
VSLLRTAWARQLEPVMNALADSRPRQGCRRATGARRTHLGWAARAPLPPLGHPSFDPCLFIRVSGDLQRTDHVGERTEPALSRILATAPGRAGLSAKPRKYARNEPPCPTGQHVEISGRNPRLHANIDRPRPELRLAVSREAIATLVIMIAGADQLRPKATGPLFCLWYLVPTTIACTCNNNNTRAELRLDRISPTQSAFRQHEPDETGCLY